MNVSPESNFFRRNLRKHRKKASSVFSTKLYQAPNHNNGMYSYLLMVNCQWLIVMPGT